MAVPPPGPVHTTPANKFVRNAPFDERHTYRLKIMNISNRRIGWKIRTSNAVRLGVSPSCGVLDYNETAEVAVSCDAFDFTAESTQNDRITIEWTNTPRGASKQFRPEWFTAAGHGQVRRKNLSIEYNL